VKFELDIFCSGAGQVGVQVNSVRHFGHQPFRKTHGPPMVVIFEHRAEGVSASVRCIIVGAGVVDSPIHELQIGIGPVRIEVEKIGQAEFTEAHLEAALGQFVKNRKGSLVNRFFSAAERNDLMDHQTRDVGHFTQRGIAHDIEIREPRKAQRLADAVSARFLHVAKKCSRRG